MRVGLARRALRIVSHLAVWPGVYVVGSVACAAQVAGLDTGLDTGLGTGLGTGHGAPRIGLVLGFVFATATAVYLLDRVKLRDAWLDPADAAAVPERHAFLTRSAALVRSLVAALWVTGTVLGFLITPIAALAPSMALAGVLVYAGRPRGGRARPKDRFVLKNVFVAAGITGMAVGTSLLADYPRDWLFAAWDAVLPLGCAAVFVFARVLVDAVLCDLDDASADRAFGTATLPGRLGRRRAWDVAIAGRVAAGLALVVMTPLPLAARLAWSITTVLTSVGLRIVAPSRTRDPVDALFGIEAGVVAAVLLAFPAATDLG